MQAEVHPYPAVDYTHCVPLSPFLLSGLGRFVTLAGLAVAPHDQAAGPSFPTLAFNKSVWWLIVRLLGTPTPEQVPVIVRPVQSGLKEHHATILKHAI